MTRIHGCDICSLDDGKGVGNAKQRMRFGYARYPANSLHHFAWLPGSYEGFCQVVEG
jgi:hypothetical protein